MIEQRETLSFGEEFGEPFRLEVRLDSQGREHLTLFHGQRAMKDEHLLDPSLRLLRYMAERARKELLEADILQALWPNPNVAPDIIDRHISYLRKALLNDDPKHPRFIATLPKRGYKFLPEVERDGDLGAIQAFPEWPTERFFEFLRKVECGSGQETEDLRILTTGFSSGVRDMHLDALLRRGVRIKILMLNPKNEALVNARHSLRRDKSKERAVRELKEQIEEIEKLARDYPPSGERGGTIELALSDMMPCGFVVHTRHSALLGIFPAHDSYVAGPMLDIRCDTETWRTLYADWKERWDDARKPVRKEPRGR